MPKSDTPSAKQLNAFTTAIAKLGNAGLATQEKFYKLFHKFWETEEVKELYEELWPVEKKIADGILKDLTGEDLLQDMLGHHYRVLPALPFQLPDIPLRLIYEELSPYDLMKFAFISTHSKDLIKSVNIPLEEFEVQIYKGGMSMRMVNDGTPTTIHILPYPYDPWKEHQGGRKWVTDTITIDGTLITIAFNGDDQDQRDVWWFGKDKEDANNLLLAMTCLIIEIFDTKALSFLNASDEKERTFEFIEAHGKQGTTKFKTLSIGNTRGRVERADITLNYEEFRFLMQEVNLDQLDLVFVTPYYLGPLTPRKVCICGARWLTTDHILNMKTRNLNARFVRFTSKQLVQFVRNWKNGDSLKDLEYVYLEWNGARENERFLMRNYLEIAEGVGATEWHPPFNNEKFNGDCSEVNNHHAFYLRNRDGVLATMKVKLGEFEFYVRSGWDIDA